MLYITQAPGAALVCAAATKSALACYADHVGVGQGELSSVSYSLIYLIIWSFCMRVVWESVL
jgi:hypothetical protein